jgi:hypothetical protein
VLGIKVDLSYWFLAQIACLRTIFHFSTSRLWFGNTNLHGFGRVHKSRPQLLSSCSLWRHSHGDPTSVEHYRSAFELAGQFDVPRFLYWLGAKEDPAGELLPEVFEPAHRHRI